MGARVASARVGVMILVDSDILIDAGHEVQAAVQFLDLHAAELAVSTISHMELLVGCRNKAEQNKLERFLSRFQSVPCSKDISERAVTLMREYRLSHGLLIPDALIAASCLQLNVALATKNRRDFAFIAGLQLADI